MRVCSRNAGRKRNSIRRFTRSDERANCSGSRIAPSKMQIVNQPVKNRTLSSLLLFPIVLDGNGIAGCVTEIITLAKPSMDPYYFSLSRCIHTHIYMTLLALTLDAFMTNERAARTIFFFFYFSLSRRPITNHARAVNAFNCETNARYIGNLSR